MGSSDKISGSVPSSEERKLYLASGGVCAFPGCGNSLVLDNESGESYIGESAHIVARSKRGPRGDVDLDDESRKKAENLVLLCRNCHKRVDSDKLTYTAKVLRQMKQDHESLVRERVGPTRQAEPVAVEEHEMLSTFLPVLYQPTCVYSAPCICSPAQIYESLRTQPPRNPPVLAPFLLKSDNLLTFNDLTAADGVFAAVSNHTLATSIPRADLLKSEDQSRDYVALMNWALHEYCGMLALGHDKRHSRYYFLAKEPEQTRSEEYSSTAGRRVTRKVVWQPTTRLTGLPKRFWLHVAASLRFHKLDDEQWALSIRPERHLTHDGIVPLPPEEIGPRVTRLKARMYNGPYLDEVNLWRSYLSNSRPRILLRMGRQAIVVDARLLAFRCSHPAVPGAEKPVSDRQYEEDLFSLADFTETVSREEREADETADEFGKYDVD